MPEKLVELFGARVVHDFLLCKCLSLPFVVDSVRSGLLGGCVFLFLLLLILFVPGWLGRLPVARLLLGPPLTFLSAILAASG